ncbi:hypothetical protein GGER_15520 [Serratia rubidaea]
MRDTYTLLGCRGCGSTIVAAALELTGFPWGYEEVDYAADSPERERLLRLNPLGEVPTLILPNNEVMTESAAIVLLLHARAPMRSWRRRRARRRCRVFALADVYQ